MRALVVDDQRDFFESVRPVLRKSGFHLTYASDLESAKSNLYSTTFDLVLTDLQMPPGSWGGLEIIKLVRHVDSVVPLYVVSGKGQLAESIEAMRLGADDYLRKEVFQSEFTTRVLPRFEKPYALESYPSVIAYLFKLFDEESQGYLQAKRLIDVYENIVRFLALLILSEELCHRSISSNDLINEVGLARPSLGSYVSFVFDQLDGNWAGEFLSLLRASDLGRRRPDCDRLTKCRNNAFGHSILISNARSIEIIGEFTSVLTQLLNCISCLRQFRLIVPERLRYNGIVFSVDGKLLSGSNLHHRPISVEIEKAVPTQHVLAIRGASVIDLYPFIDVVTAETGDRHFYKIYNKLTDRGMDFDLIPH